MTHRGIVRPADAVVANASCATPGMLAVRLSLAGNLLIAADHNGKVEAMLPARIVRSNNDGSEP